MLLVPVVPRLVHPRVRHVHPHPLPVRRGERVGGVDPAVGVEDVLWDVPRVDAHDGRADVLPRRHDEGEGQQGHHRDAVVQPEHGAVRVVAAHLHQALEPEEEVQHGEARSVSSSKAKKKRLEPVLCRAFDQGGFSSFPRATYLFLSLHEEERESGMSNSDFVSPKRNLKGGGDPCSCCGLFVLNTGAGGNDFFPPLLPPHPAAFWRSFVVIVVVSRGFVFLFLRATAAHFLGGKARSDVGPLIGMSYFLFFSSSRSSFPPREGKSFGGRAGAVNSLLLLLLLLLRTPGVFMFDRYAVQLVG